MMFGRGVYGAGSCGFFGPFMMIGFVILIAVIIYLLLKTNKSKSTEYKSTESKSDSRLEDSKAIEILKEKFAKGEMTEEEYLNKKNILERR